MVTMTSSEFETKEQEILAKVPLEFRAALSYRAYEDGHSAGYEEVLNILTDLVDDLITPITEYTKRIQQNK